MASPFTRAVVSSMRHLYPEVLADKSFDNTGLLLEAPYLSSRRNRNSVLLTIDLTKAVAEEAIQNNHSVVIAYHPIIFRGLKSLTLEDSQQHSLLRLAAHGISVYSPHTAVDIVPGGMADWLCDIVTGRLDAPEPEAFTIESADPESSTSDTDVTTSESENEATTDPMADADGDTREAKPQANHVANHGTDPPIKDEQPPSTETDPFTTPRQRPSKSHLKRPSASHRTYSRPTYPRPPPSTFHPASLPHKRAVITSSPQSAIDAANALTCSNSYTPKNTGHGRLITFDTPQPLTLLITRIAHAIGLPKGFPIAIPQGVSVEDVQVKTVGVCPGSGAGVISKVEGGKVDLVFTGEMTHHDTLAVVERGGCVVALFHSNSERGYLSGMMEGKLKESVGKEWGRVRREVKEGGGGREGWEDGLEEILEDETVEVWMSEVDRDPYGIVVLVESTVEGVGIGGS